MCRGLSRIKRNPSASHRRAFLLLAKALSEFSPQVPGSGLGLRAFCHPSTFVYFQFYSRILNSGVAAYAVVARGEIWPSRNMILDIARGRAADVAGV